MSKYKVGDKVVVEITDRFKNAYGHEYYSILDSVYSTEFIDEKSEPLANYTEPLSNKVADQRKEINHLLRKIKEKEAAIERLEDELRSRAQKLTWQKGVEAGQKEAWELARKIVRQPINGGYKQSEFEKIFGYGYISDIFEKYKYTEAAAKVEAWEKAKEEIKVGDIVRLQEGSDNDLCILCKTSDEKYYNAVDKYGALYPLLTKEHFSKTGRHIDIDSFLKQIGGGDDEK